ncbi:MAG: hypothetical protein J6R99_02535 [Alphaproteobacteria bacterium]|jgi:hypothetical protein|nr:hypothetical protein [Alphaproteobacteria bacterium]
MSGYNCGYDGFSCPKKEQHCREMREKLIEMANSYPTGLIVTGVGLYDKCPLRYPEQCARYRQYVQKTK